MKDDCASCRFWRRLQEDKMDGVCRRRSPQPSLLMIEHIADMLGHMSSAQYSAAGVEPDDVEDFYPAPGESSYQTQWPTVHQSDWCGEFEATLRDAA